MPSAAAILDSLTVITSEWRGLAIAWHAAFALLALAMWRRPAPRIIAMFLIAPVVSVSALAWWSGNPFNGSTFAALALALALTARRLEPAAAALGTPLERRAGAMLVVFGLLYPHFLRTDSWTAYAYATPFGLIPCPTLAVVAGVSLIAASFGSRRWASLVMAAALFYGVIGVVLLDVWIDLALVAGGIVLLGSRRQRLGRSETFRAAAGVFPLLRERSR